MEKEERELFKKGRKIQILILLKRNGKMTPKEICDETGILHSNLTKFTHPLYENGFAKQYPQHEVKKSGFVDRRKYFIEITTQGEYLVDELPQTKQTEFLSYRVPEAIAV